MAGFAWTVDLPRVEPPEIVEPPAARMVVASPRSVGSRPVPVRQIAAFDFDGTLTRSDTLLPFLGWSCGRAALARALVQAAPTAARARTGRLTESTHPRDASKAVLLDRLFAGRSQDWFGDRGQHYATMLGRRLRPDVLARVEWHRGQGHELLIVSASLHTYLDHFAAEHGFDHVIAVEMQVTNGVLSGDLVGPNVRGPEKAVRLRNWIGDDLDQTHLWAYGNSTGDRELLAMADDPTWVAKAALTTPPLS